MNKKMLMLALAAAVMPLSLAVLAQEHRSTPTLEQVMASSSFRITETRILDCNDLHFPTPIQVWRFTEAGSMYQAQRSSQKMRQDSHRVCARSDQVKLVFLAPAHRSSEQVAVIPTGVSVQVAAR